ncbi:MAG: histidinol-phosphatase HisJ family protein [Clostridia bacterium]|nr:histidinol-phosphatase HisJ family protein [Clostridia bacterium]
MYDIHAHSTFSPDSISPVEEYIGVLDEGRVEGIGFAEHFDFLPECGAYGYLDYELLRKTIDEFSSKGYRVFAGAEIDYSFKVEDEIVSTLRERHFDFTICSIHMVSGVSVSDGKNLERFKDKKIFRSIIEEYYYELSSSLRVKEFDVIGHIGIYRRHFDQSFINESIFNNWIIELENEVAKACALSDKIIEVNTSGLFSKCAFALPHADFLKTYYLNGGRLLSLGSDAHNAAHIGRGFREALEVLKDIGFKYIMLPWDRENPLKIE